MSQSTEKNGIEIRGSKEDREGMALELIHLIQNYNYEDAGHFARDTMYYAGELLKKLLFEDDQQN